MLVQRRSEQSGRRFFLWSMLAVDDSMEPAMRMPPCAASLPSGGRFIHGRRNHLWRFRLASNPIGILDALDQLN